MRADGGGHRGVLDLQVGAAAVLSVIAPLAPRWEVAECEGLMKWQR